MRRFFIVALLCFSFPMSSALAEKPEKQQKHEKHEKHEKQDGGALIDVDVTVGFTPEQRNLAHAYHDSNYGKGHCPPGLAKKNNGCLPPGQAKKRYSVGKALPPDLVVIDLPGDLQVRLGKPPKGIRYGIVDGDVVKVAVGTLLVIDAIDGLAN